MGAGDRPGWTVLVLGKPGETSRRYRISRRAIVLLLLAIPCAGLGIGYVLRSRHLATPAQVAPAAAASSDLPAVAAPALPAIPTLTPAKTAVSADAGELA